MNNINQNEITIMMESRITDYSVQMKKMHEVLQDHLSAQEVNELSENDVLQLFYDDLSILLQFKQMGGKLPPLQLGVIKY